MRIGLCEGRHEIPQIKDYIFPADFFSEPGSMFDFKRMQGRISQKLMSENEIHVYVTGLTVALVEVIKYCQDRNIILTLWHFDRESGQYIPQFV